MHAFPVVDAHVHFWNPALLQYPWLDRHPSLHRAMLPGAYAPLGAGTVDAVVVVEANPLAAQSGDEIAFVEQLAAHEPRIAGTVACVDLRADDLPDVLDRIAQVERVTGVRHNIQGQPAGFALAPAFVRGVQAAGARGLSFDLCITASQFDEAIALVAQCPGTRFVLDHCGKPAIRDDAFEPWAAAIAGLAGHENVVCKLSGLLTEARPPQRSYETLFPYMEHAALSFGTSRLLYGSDWPVVESAGGVDLWRALVDRFSAAWSVEDVQSFFCDNAVRAYRLKIHATR